HHRRRRTAAVAAVLDYTADRDAGIVAGRVSDKPRVIAVLPGDIFFLSPRAGGFLDQLRGAGFAAHLDPWDRRFARGTHRAVDHTAHARMHEFPLFGSQRDARLHF